MAQRLGPKSRYDYSSKEDQIYGWMDGMNTGPMGFNFGEVPKDCIDFCYEQYHRFNIPVFDGIDNVISIGASYSFFHLDVISPYGLFCGISDVDFTDAWAEHAYEMWDDYHKKTVELDPESMETFEFVPGQSERVFDEIMSHPGLLALPNGIGDDVDDNMNGGIYYEESCFDHTDRESLEALKAACAESDGSTNWTRARAYYNMAAWAGCAWLVGPLGRNYRMSTHDVMYAAITHGEALIYEGCTYDPTAYKKLKRPAKSCYKCGTCSWCVELVSSLGTTRYMCEHCLSEGMPPSPIASCGSKRCLLTACMHHPYHGMGAAGIGRTRDKFGQLSGQSRAGSKQQILIGG